MVTLVAGNDIKFIRPGLQCGTDDTFDQRNAQNRDEGLAVTLLLQSPALARRDNQALHPYRLSLR